MALTIALDGELEKEGELPSQRGRNHLPNSIL